ncbi:lanthionine synthetase LanC family protein [Peptostreptococcus sp. D1]|uniref:lanthionine synthetase LanC family protein n=1 Tax=Peptostreptococcus sp. D1 TaxID=72304 RepID=UPI0008E331C7|nr:lanthionine synthetase LanC family protein [Peptostreptococcus sp. D1]SFE66859.1 Lanthionine synthetase C-like protein [Peptostreptococcus sp. D1]
MKNGIYLENNINKIVFSYLDYVCELYDNNIISPYDYENIILSIGVLYDFIPDENKEKFLDIAYDVSKAIKQKIEFGNDMNISMFIGLGFTAFSMNIFSKKTKILTIFSKSLNDLLLEECYRFSEDNLGKDNYKTEDYDLIVGVSGVLHYLIDIYHDDKKNIHKLKKICEFLIYIVSDYEYNGNIYPRFYVTKENLHNEVYKEVFPNGSINLSLSHGIISILVVLCEFKKYNIKILGLDESINKLFKIYDRYIVEGNKHICTQISIEDYIDNKDIEIEYQRESWCYGYASILRALITASDMVDDYKENTKYKKIINKVLSREYDEFSLDENILCHGNASIIAIILSNDYHEADDEIYNNVIIAIKKILNEFKKEDFEFSEKGLNFLEGNSGIIIAISMLLKKNIDILRFLMLC